MRCAARWALLIAAFLLSARTAPADDQPLKEFQRVVVPDEPLAVQQTAANELVEYVGRIVGRKLEIVPLANYSSKSPGLSFFVGDGPAAKILGEKLTPWQTEEWLLRSAPRGLVLAGHDGAGDAWSASTPSGTLLATYTLLDDHLGVKWFWPGKVGEHVPQQPDVKITALNLRQQPAFEIRSVSPGYTTYHTKDFKLASRQWAKRSRLGWVRSAVFGHSWFDAFNLRNDESFKAHPEWFALVDGQRRPPQMCTTNPAVIDTMVEYVLKGKQDIVNISPSDGGGFCECENCRKLDVPGVLAQDNKHIQLSDRIFTYANEVARRVREQNPHKGCGIIAYTYYNRPPLKIEKLEPNLYLSYVYQSAAHRDPENLSEWRERVAGWQKLGAKMVVREGWGNHYYHDLPFVHTTQIISNLAEAGRRGFVAVYGEGTKNFATTAPNYWALTRMMWNPQRDTTHLMRDYYAAAYGPAAAEMTAYFEAYDQAFAQNWSKRPRNVDTNAIAYANLIGFWGELLPLATIDAAEQHLKAAEAKAPAGEYADRVKFHRLGQDYTRLMMELLTSYRRLAVLGVQMDYFSAVVKERMDAPTERDALLKRIYELGEQREAMLLANREVAGPDEGLYAITNDLDIRRWHSTVKKALGIDKPSELVKSKLLGSK